MTASLTRAGSEWHGPSMATRKKPKSKPKVKKKPVAKKPIAKKKELLFSDDFERAEILEVRENNFRECIDRRLVGHLKLGTNLIFVFVDARGNGLLLRENRSRK